MQVDFYLVGGEGPAPVVARLAERVVADGGRLLVVTADTPAAARMDEALWAGPADGFLPHGRAGGADDARQPVLIADTPAAANGARAIALVDGLWRDEALTFDRAFHIFDAASTEAARAAWRGLGSRDGLVRNFWKQEDGRWQKIA